MVAPRKYRNAEERVAICDEAREKLKQVGITDEENEKVEAVFNAFCALTCGKTLQGTIELETISSVVEYFLPGRRIMPHMMRLKRNQEEPKH